MILACTMAAILFLLSLQQSSLFRVSKSKTLTDTTTVDWAVSKAVTVANDPLVEDELAVELKEKEVEVKEEVAKEEEKEVAKEEIEDARDEPQEDEPEEANLEGLRLGDEATSMEDEAPEEDADDYGFLQVTLKSVPVSLL